MGENHVCRSVCVVCVLREARNSVKHEISTASEAVLMLLKHAG